MRKSEKEACAFFPVGREAPLPKAVWDQLRQCFDPESPVNIVDLGLVYDCQLVQKPEGGTKVEVKMTVTAPGCGMGRDRA